MYSVRFARNSCHLNANTVKRESKGPGRFHNGDEMRLERNSTADAVATRKSTGNESSNMTGLSKKTG